MFKEDTPWRLIYNWWKYKPEDELYYRLEENPHWPFKMIAEGYYYVIVQSDRAAYGFYGFLGFFISYFVCTFFMGFYAIPQTGFLMAFGICIWALRGRIAWRELIISRRGRGSYMLRVLSNQEVVLEHELRNIYIRLTRKDDSSGDAYYWLNLSGYKLDDYRITRMTKAENALRIMGMQLAYRLGVNFFDWKDESEDHFIFHYKTYTRLAFHLSHHKSDEEMDLSKDKEATVEGEGVQSGEERDMKEKEEPKKGAFLSVPTKRRKMGEYETDFPTLSPMKKLKEEDTGGKKEKDSKKGDASKKK